ncbi:MAG: cupin domain-containing protein [Methylococcales bacterium]
MSILTIYPEMQPQHGVRYTDFDTIQSHLHSLGVQFDHWDATYSLATDADQNTILEVYREPINELKQKHYFQSIDVINIKPDHPEKDIIRKKFLAEHLHDDFEIRFFIEGRGLFYLHVGGKVYIVLCEKGDSISVPAHTKHWFDMGENPNFTCIRLFTTPYGWVANFTGDPIADTFPTLDQFVAELS